MKLKTSLSTISLSLLVIIVLTTSISAQGVLLEEGQSGLLQTGHMPTPKTPTAEDS